MWLSSFAVVHHHSTHRAAGFPAIVAVAAIDSAQRAIDLGSGLDFGAEVDSHIVDRSQCRLHSEAVDKHLVVGRHQAVV